MPKFDAMLHLTFLLRKLFFTQGPRSTGGVGDILKRISYNEEERAHYFLRFFYDLTFFVLINIIILNIVFGTIISAFAALRDARHKLLQDIQNNCFICSLPRTTFDNIPNGFMVHKEQEHNTRNYIYFLYNVRFKLRRRLMGMELYVDELKNDRSSSWLPLMRSSRLSDSAEMQLDERLKNLHERFVALRKYLQNQT